MTSDFRNHYIPEFYQRGFIADDCGLIWVYEKGRQPRQESVRKTGMELNLYAFVNQKKELDTQTIENELARLDSDGARVIHKLEKGLLLTETERWTLCRFVSVMWRRTIKHKNQAEQMATGMIKKFFEDHDDKWLYDRLRERVKSETETKTLFDKQKAELEEIREEYTRQVPSFLFPSNALRESMFEKVLFTMDWAYFRATRDTEFVTCDDPVAFNKGTGLKNKQAVIIFPQLRVGFLDTRSLTKIGLSMIEILLFAPGGTGENSPPIYRWERVSNSVLAGAASSE
jgi:hypothetical protein